MDFQITPTISSGTILLLVGFAGTVIGTAMVLYFKLKTKWFDLNAEYLKHVKDVTDNQTVVVQTALNAQTARIEECIHKLPTHPENNDNSTSVA